MSKDRRRFIRTDADSIAALGDPFRPLEPDCKVVQFGEPLTTAELRKVGQLVAGRPDVQLYVYRSASRDLDFLEWFPDLRRLHLALYDLEDIGGLASVIATLQAFTFGRTRRRFSLRFLDQAGALDHLFLVGHDKDLDVVSGLAQITQLGLSGVTLPDLSLLRPLRRLSALSIMLGSTRNLEGLAELAGLHDLFLMRITGLSDVGVLRELKGLTKLRLDWMRNVTALPSLAGLPGLTNVVLDTMKGLSDLAPLAAAPALERLSIVNMPQLTPASFEPFLGHPSLAMLSAHTGKAKVGAAVKAMFPGIAR